MKVKNKQSEENLYAVAYMRYSSNNQDMNSIEYQRSNIQKYCKRYGITILHEYIDCAQTGTSDRRKAFKQMINDAQKKPKWNMVIINHTSRFARNEKDALYYTGLLEDRNIEVVSVNQYFEKSAHGKLQRSINYAFDAHSSNVNAETTHSGMLEKAKSGNHCGGIPPLGFDLGADKTLVINQREAKAVQMIFNMYEQGFSLSNISEKLNAAGYRTKKGALFCKNSFDSILSQKKYIGTYIWNKAKQKNNQYRRNSHAEKPIEEQVIKEDAIPAIITKEQFERVQQERKTRGKKNASSTTKNNYMLSGLKILRCAECGSYLVGNPRKCHGIDYTTYTCPNHKLRGGKFNTKCPTKEIRTEYLDDAVAKLIAKDLYKRTDLKEISDYLNHNEDYKELLKMRKNIEKSIRNTFKMLDCGCTDLVKERLQSLSAEKRTIEAEIARCESGRFELSKENIKDVCKKLREHLKTSSSLEVKSYIKDIISDITVSNEGVSITLNIA